MKRTAYQINQQTNIGIEFKGSNGIYFWVPSNSLYRWGGYSGWMNIPIANLGARRRAALTQVWEGNAA
jgi:hypothetical protein